MAPFGLSRLRSLLRREGRQGHTTPTASWSRPFGQGWESPYTVRYASNLDDGPWHGAPLGGFGAGCISGVGGAGGGLGKVVLAARKYCGRLYQRVDFPRCFTGDAVKKKLKNRAR